MMGFAALNPGAAHSYPRTVGRGRRRLWPAQQLVWHPGPSMMAQLNTLKDLCIGPTAIAVRVCAPEHIAGPSTARPLRDATAVDEIAIQPTGFVNRDASLWRSPPCDANAAPPSRAPADRSAGVTDCGPCNAPAVDHCPARTAAKADLRDRVVRLRQRRGRESLRRCRDGQGKASNGDQPDHAFLHACTIFREGVGPPIGAR